IGLLLRPHLEELGYRVSIARNLAEARAALTAPCDGLLLDLHLPDGSGLDLLRELRSSQATRALPVIVLTAEGAEGVLAAAKSLDATRLTGPFLVDQVAGLVPGVPRAQVFAEPRAASTAPPLAWAAHWIARQDPGAQMLSLHADWAVGDERAFRSAARTALGVAEDYDVLVT